jgi:hypothetical protein
MPAPKTSAKCKQTSQHIQQCQQRNHHQQELNQLSIHGNLQLQNFAHQQAEELKTMLHLHFGFQVNPALPVWTNAEQVQASQTPKTIDHQVSNLKFHNLCTHLAPPLGLNSILGYDLKHCVQHKTPQTDASQILDQLECDVHICFRHSNYTEASKKTKDNPNETYDPKIYVKLKD